MCNQKEFFVVVAPTVVSLVAFLILLHQSVASFPLPHHFLLHLHSMKNNSEWNTLGRIWIQDEHVQWSNHQCQCQNLKHHKSITTFSWRTWFSCIGKSTLSFYTTQYLKLVFPDSACKTVPLRHILMSKNKCDADQKTVILHFDTKCIQ